MIVVTKTMASNKYKQPPSTSFFELNRSGISGFIKTRVPIINSNAILNQLYYTKYAATQIQPPSAFFFELNNSGIMVFSKISYTKDTPNKILGFPILHKLPEGHNRPNLLADLDKLLFSGIIGYVSNCHEPNKHQETNPNRKITHITL